MPRPRISQFLTGPAPDNLGEEGDADAHQERVSPRRRPRGWRLFGAQLLVVVDGGFQRLVHGGLDSRRCRIPSRKREV